MDTVICDKEGFTDYKVCVERMIGLVKKYGSKHKYRIYKCPYCEMFHISTITKKVLQTRSKKFDKYPIKVEVKKENKMPPVNPNKNPKMKKEPVTPPPFRASQPVLTPLQAEILKHKLKFQ